MQIKFLKSYLQAQNDSNKITALAWSPNNLKLAACNSERVILLFDDNGERKDKFATKPADPKAGKNSYSVLGLAFSPDSTKIAIAQSDQMVYVYRIGEEWGEKKVICNKFSQSSAVTAVTWPSEGPLICGLADGKVRECVLKANKARTLYAGNSMVVSLSVNARGTGFLSGHADGTIARYYIAEDAFMEQQGRIAQHPVPPYALAWPTTGHVIVAGCDKRILVYDKDGQVSQTFDFSKDPEEREFTVACNSPSGQAAVFGSYNKLQIVSWDLRRTEWIYETKEIKDLYSVTALAWRRDGSKVACSGLCGSIEVFESVLKRTVWRNKFEMVYVAPSQVLVRPLHGDQPRGVILRSKYGHEISEVRIAGVNDQFLVARTSHSILLGDMSRNLLSEVPWVSPHGNEKFSFDNPTVCLVFHAGELSLVEYGNNNVLSSVRTEFMNPHLISVRINERQVQEEDNKKLAYLLDLKTICVVDLVTGSVLGQMSHDARINWLELSEPADKLLFRDSKHRLWLLPLTNHARAWHKVALLANCSFVQWVSSSDVVVAQSGSTLCVWYNLESTEGATQVAIKGDVVDVTREEGKTEVIVEEGRGQRVAYALDEGMVEFGTALQDGNLERALAYLESLPQNDDSQETMWRALAAVALSEKSLKIAHRCHEVLGNKARTFYLQKTMKIAEDYAGKIGGDGMDCPEVQARLFMLDKQFRAAEDVYLQSGDVASAIKMYEQFCMYEEALGVAERYGSPEQGALRLKLEKWYMETMQEDKAGERKEEEGAFSEAIDLYLKAEMPKKASRTLLKEPSLLQDEVLVGKVANALGKGGQMELAGDLWGRVSRQDKALECYKKGGAFSKAVQICRDTKPADVVKLEGEWAEYLMTQRQFDAAISHFIEAGHTSRALEASVKAGQWKKAKQIIEVIEDKKTVQKYFHQLGKHFADEKDYRNAEAMFLEGGAITDAVEMYTNSGQWEKAWKIANKHMGEDDAGKVLSMPAEKLIGSGKFRDAEKLLIVMGKASKAVEMYREQKRYDEMCRVASTHMSVDECKTLQQAVAAELQTSKAWRASEKLLCSAGDWKGAVAMYKKQGMWDEALRVAKAQGGVTAWRNVAFLWALELGGLAAVKLLDRLTLLEFAIEHACDNYQFDFAFELSRLAQPTKMNEIHYKYALALEDDGKFPQAEEHFIKSGKPKEAVHMYVHSQEFDRALKIAEEHSPEDVNDVLEAQAKMALSHSDMTTFEALMIRAQRAEVVVQQYRDNGNWMDALRVCKEHLPSKLSTLEAQYKRETGQRGRGGGGGSEGAPVLGEARKLEEGGQHQKAIDLLLRVSPKNCGDPNTIAKAWIKAVELTLKYLGEDEARRIAKAFGSQLVEINQHAAAAQMLLSADLVQEAVEVLMAAGEWNKARKIAQQLEPRLENYVEKGYKSWLKSQGRTDQLADMDVAEAIEVLAQQEQWPKCKQVAQENGALSTYLVLHASHLLRNGKALDALEVYASNQPIPTLDSGTLSTIRMLALAVLSLPNISGAQHYKSWAALRNILLQMSEDFSSTQKYPEIRTLLTLAHFCAIRSACREVDGLESLAAKLSIALLRFTDVIPSDKAFFEAGMDAKELGWDSEAFVFLNRLLDVCEAIEEIESGGAPTLLDPTDLQCTDFPTDAPLPRKMTISPQALEEAREWLLAVSMDQKIDQNLPLDFRGVYAACLQANEAESPVEMCILSGWPVLNENVQLGNHLATKQEWNSLLLASRTHHGHALDDVLRFLGKWCGKLPEGFKFGMK